MKREISHQQEPEESQGLVDGVKDFERERMQAWLKAELQKERKKRFHLPLRPMQIAASIALLVAASWMVINQFSYWDRLEAKYTLGETAVNLMGEEMPDQQAMSLLEQAAVLIKDADLEEALTVLEQVAIQEQQYDEYFKARYQMIQIYLMQKDTEKAKALGKELLDRREKHYLKSKIKSLMKDLKRPKFLFFG
ncbi:MAG: hypothetical protein MK226_18890 [Saprospiraceae bacterium]|nr:hypothetical protein [Saprospiraceae bacterium]